MASTGRWSDELTFKFITLYRDRPCLWQSDSPQYKCKALRQDALGTLVDEMSLGGFDVNSCKLKIKNLRSHYCQELKKIRFSHDCGASEYRPSLAWFPLLHAFLKRYVHQNVDLNEAISSYPEGKADPEVVDPELDEEEDDNEEREDFDIIPHIVFKQEPDDDTVPNGNNTRCLHNNNNARKKRVSLSRYRRNKQSNCFRYENEEPETEFDIFCRSVALQLNNLPLENALRLQHNIQNLVTEERLNCLQRQQQQLQQT